MSGFDHFADDGEKSVGDASEGSDVFMSAASQRAIFRPAGAVALDGGQDGGSDAGNGAQDVDGLPAFHCLDPVEDLFDFGVKCFELIHGPLGGVGDGNAISWLRYRNYWRPLPRYT